MEKRQAAGIMNPTKRPRYAVASSPPPLVAEENPTPWDAYRNDIEKGTALVPEQDQGSPTTSAARSTPPWDAYRNTEVTGLVPEQDEGSPTTSAARSTPWDAYRNIEGTALVPEQDEGSPTTSAAGHDQFSVLQEEKPRLDQRQHQGRSPKAQTEQGYAIPTRNERRPDGVKLNIPYITMKFDDALIHVDESSFKGPYVLKCKRGFFRVKYRLRNRNIYYGLITVPCSVEITQRK